MIRRKSIWRQAFISNFIFISVHSLSEVFLSSTEHSNAQRNHRPHWPCYAGKEPWLTAGPPEFFPSVTVGAAFHRATQRTFFSDDSPGTRSLTGQLQEFTPQAQEGASCSQEPGPFATIPQAQCSRPLKKHASDHTQERPKRKAPTGHFWFIYTPSMPEAIYQSHQFTQAVRPLQSNWLKTIVCYFPKVQRRKLMVRFSCSRKKGFANIFTHSHRLAVWS